MKNRRALGIQSLLIIGIVLLSSSFSALQVHGATAWLTKEQIIAGLKQLCDEHTDVATSESIGKTVLGNDIWLFRLGTNPQAKILIDGATHGHELPGSHSIYFLAQWLLSGSTEANIVLSRMQVLLVPIVNYDNARPPGEGPSTDRKNENGVDLNRNHVRGWSASTDPTSLYYSGPHAASEPETQAMNDLYEAESPRVYVSIHDWGGNEPTNNGSFYPRSYGGITYTNEINELYNSYLTIIEDFGFAPHGNIPTGAYGSSVDDGYLNGLTLSFLWEQTQTHTTKPETVTYELINEQKWHHLKAFTMAAANLYGAIPESTPAPTVIPFVTPTPTATVIPTTTPTSTPTASPSESPSSSNPHSQTPQPQETAIRPETFYAAVTLCLSFTIVIAVIILRKQRIKRITDQAHKHSI